MMINLDREVHEQCDIAINSDVPEVLWQHIMTGIVIENKWTGDKERIILPDYLGVNGNDYDNAIFTVKSYDWGDDRTANDWHFYHKPSGLKLRWYKYPCREMYSNMEFTNEELLMVLEDCINSVYLFSEDEFIISLRVINTPWWGYDFINEWKAMLEECDLDWKDNRYIMMYDKR